MFANANFPLSIEGGTKDDSADSCTCFVAAGRYEPLVAVAMVEICLDAKGQNIQDSKIYVWFYSANTRSDHEEWSSM